MHLLVWKIDLVDAIDERLHLLMFQMLYNESDHFLSFRLQRAADRSGWFRDAGF